MGIERYRAIVRLEEIRSLMEAGEYEAAKVTADSIKTERLKDSGDLFLLASVYRKCGEFGTAKDFLMRIYEKKANWRVLEELMEVCLAEKNPEEAELYFKEYVKLSGGDPRNYIYEYRIGRQKHRPDEELLPVLQTLKAEEYTEKYAYELAKLYHKLGRGQECMAECADLILWFGEGTYVERAKALQAYYRGELSVDDIRMEAERRIQEAEERREKEEQERKAFEEEQQRSEEESYHLLEEEQLALEEVYRSVAKEHFSGEEPVAYTEEPMYESEPEEAFEAPAEDGEEQAPEEDLEEYLEEAAAAESDEPMWEEDDSVAVSEEEEPEAEYVAAESVAGEEPEDYEQMSLFAPQPEEPAEEEPEEAPTTANAEETQEAFEAEVQAEIPAEEPQVLSPLGKELSARLAERGLVFEDLLHEFARIERVRKQLARMLEVVVTVRKKCHCLIITGEQNSGKTTLGTYLAKLLYELAYVKTPRVAKISGERLNRINLFEKTEQLRDVCLIVESAGAMTEATAEMLLEFIRKTDVLGTVILEDNANAMNGLLRNNAECNREFNNRVHLPKYDSGELMCFALEHIKEQDYGITPEAKKILADNISRVTRVEPQDGRLAATLGFVREALKNADYRNQGTILAMASAGNFLAAEALELTAEDFGVIR